jgi:hypothetical protein
VTVNSGSAITSAENSYADLTDAQKAKITNYSTLTDARAEYDAIRPVYDDIEDLPENIAVTDANAVNEAYEAYKALTDDQKAKVTNADEIIAAKAEIDAIYPVYTAIGELPSAANTAIDDRDAIYNAFNAYNGLSDGQQAKITNSQALTDAKAEIDTIYPVYEAIGALEVHLDTYDDLSTAKEAYNGLTHAQKSKVDTANYSALAAANSAYEAMRPKAKMSAVPDSSKITANFYVEIPATEADHIDGLTVTVGETTVALNSLDSEEVGGVIRYSLPLNVVARKMVDAIAYSLSGDVTSGYQSNPYFSSTTTVKAYCEAIIKGDFDASYKEIARCMLIYGGAAQVYFGYETSNRADKDLAATLTAAGISAPTTPTDAASNADIAAFDSTDLKDALKENASIPVTFSAYNITFEADTQILLSFRIKGVMSDADTLAWVKEHITFGGNTGDDLNAKLVDGKTEGDRYVWISLKNVPLEELAAVKTIVIDTVNAGYANEYGISVMNYIAAASARGSANLKTMTSALYDYFTAVTAPVGE